MQINQALFYLRFFNKPVREKLETNYPVEIGSLVNNYKKLEMLLIDLILKLWMVIEKPNQENEMAIK